MARLEHSIRVLPRRNMVDAVSARLATDVALRMLGKDCSATLLIRPAVATVCRLDVLCAFAVYDLDCLAQLCEPTIA